jgi:hypothetical protein
VMSSPPRIRKISVPWNQIIPVPLHDSPVFEDCSYTARVITGPL